MSRVSNLATAVDRVPSGMFFVVRAVQKDIKSDLGDEDGALFIHVKTSNRTDVVRVRDSEGGVCLGRVGFEACLPKLQALVIRKLQEIGVDVEVPVIDASSADGYKGTTLAKGRGI